MPPHRIALSRAARHRAPATLEPSPLSRLIALLALAALGTTALGATAAATHGQARPAAAARVDLTSHRPLDLVDQLPASTAGRVQHDVLRALPAPARPTTAKSKAQKAAKHKRWLPTGIGMWIYEWRRSNHGNANSVVARAKKVGLSTLFVRTGSSHDGFTGAAVLRKLLPATRKTNLHVVAWDFPTLRHPRRDAARLARAAWFMYKSKGPHVAAVAPDIETPAEGTFNAGWRVRAYLKALRQKLPKGIAILATVPWPSRFRVGSYPYASVARGSDALLPMAYWYDNAPSLVTKKSITWLRRFHKPVQPVGQGYDSKLDVPSLPHNNLRKQVPAFLRTASAYGVKAVSLWSWQAAPRTAWDALARARRLFPAH